jgi:hypothetical protein
VDVYYVGSFPQEELAEIAPRVTGPDRVFGQGQFANGHKIRRIVIAALVLDDRVSRALEQFAFIAEDDVLASGLLVGIVSDDDFHAATAACSRAVLLLA